MRWWTRWWGPCGSSTICPHESFELAVHTLDLARAVSTVVTLPETAAAVAVHLLADLALQPGTVALLLLAATGRHALPAGYSVL